ncbi:SDR family NAD(P)-dependent oxidoreductase [Alicyclobacillus sp. ALC3]|uniref:SDR family NAD(P)-dependent oxidoreductase n=1 Tax=Alicyclobacillus sp. ALC3 TaxID=2796143 RepID=UPI0023788829|nr:SDR family oxidoreductase [Alicyclobacillus sp. ALC3]WDL99092.1 SDR family oxidoreductase [Alicyclobacillus sp. ALC3]
MSQENDQENDIEVDDPAPSFKNGVVAITGGTSGIGYAIAERFLRAQASVVIVGSDAARGHAAEERLRRTASSLELPNEAWFVQADVANPAAVDQAVSSIAQRYGHLESLVCSAGVGRKARLLETAASDFARLFQVNVQGAVTAVQAAAPLLTVSRGSVVLVSSDAGIVGEPDIGAYSVTKAALNMAGKMLALDLAASGVRVNVIAPGDVVPGMRTMLRPGEEVRSADDFMKWKFPPLGRYGQASEIADVALFLSSKSASFMTGAVIPVDGGMRAGLDWA